MIYINDESTEHPYSSNSNRAVVTQTTNILNN